MARRLRLSSEHLTDLTPDELSTLAGAAGTEVTLVCTSWFPAILPVVTRAVDEALETQISCTGGC